MRAVVGGILDGVQCSSRGLDCNIMQERNASSFRLMLSILRMCLILIQPLFSTVPRLGRQIFPRQVAEICTQAFGCIARS